MGKDHLMLADWLIGVPTFQQPTKENGEKLDYVEYSIERSDGTAQKVALEGGSKTGLPSAADSPIVIAAINLHRMQGFESDIVRFVPSQLLEMMGWPRNEYYLDRLQAGLKRLKSVSATYTDTWYDRKKAKVEPVLITGIVSEAKLVRRKGRRHGDAPDSYIQWTKNFHESLQDGNLIDLNLDLYFGWNRPGAQSLHRHTNKVWHGGKKPKTYERDLRELACGHLGMSDCKDLKRNFHQIVSEMETKGYFVPMPPSERYRKVRPRVWRVRMELHPDLIRGKVRPSTTERTQKDDAVALVRAYHLHRFGQEDYKPKAKELSHAESLLKAHDSSLLFLAVPKVAQAVQAQYSGKDCHFGAAVPYFELELKQRADRKRCRARESANNEQLAATHSAFNDERAKNRRIRTKHLDRWKTLTEQMQSHYYDRAIERTTSNTTRVRLLRRRDLKYPAPEALKAMASDLNCKEYSELGDSPDQTCR